MGIGVITKGVGFLPALMLIPYAYAVQGLVGRGGHAGPGAQMVARVAGNAGSDCGLAVTPDLVHRIQWFR
jgi:hypothetical protein